MIRGILFRDVLGRVFLHGEVVKDLDKKSKVVIRQREMSPPMDHNQANRLGAWLIKAAKAVTDSNQKLAFRRLGAVKGWRTRGR